MPRLTRQAKAAVDSQMKDQIYQATVRVMAAHGVQGLTMNRVAEATGVAKGTLYNYFHNKHDLLCFVHERAYEPILASVTEVRGDDGPAPRKLEVMAHRWFEYVEQHRGLFHFLLNDELLRGELKEEQERLRVQLLRSLAAIVREGIARGEFRPLDANLVAEMLMGAVRQIAELQLARGESRKADETVGGVLEVFFLGITRCPDGQSGVRA